MTGDLVRVPELTDMLVDEIGRIGKLRSPAEACGMLLEALDDRPMRAIELPNRSLAPNGEYELRGEDMRVALESYPDYRPVALWHTHPGGTLGPSQADLANVIEGVPMLIVTLLADGRVVPEWF